MRSLKIVKLKDLSLILAIGEREPDHQDNT